MTRTISILYAKASNALSHALHLEETGHAMESECSQLYRDGSTFLRCVLQETPDSDNDTQIISQCKTLLPMVQDRIQILDRKHMKNDCTSSPLSSLSNIDTGLAHSLLDEVIQNGKQIYFDDIVGQDAAKEALRESIVLPSLRSDIFKGLRSPVQGILLFGPPGNGKTLLAQAAATESKCRLFNISSSTLVSKWLGESEKLVRTLFVVAKELQPSIIFIDEADSLLNSRQAGEHDSSRRLKTEFLARFDGVSSQSDDRILVLGATNRPQDIDDAVMRRFPRRILVNMPSQNERFLILQHFLQEENHALSHDDLTEIADATKNFSASDIKSLARHAAYQSVRDMDTKTLETIDTLRPIDLADFMIALTHIRPSVKTNTLEGIEKWMKKM